MLNTNKIQSLINKGENNPAIVARGTGINYNSLRSKLKSDSWTPDDIEKLADYFGKSILYFFDKEETDTKPYKPPEPTLDVAEDYGCCKMCAEKDKRIDLLEKHIQLLELTLGKNRATG